MDNINIWKKLVKKEKTYGTPNFRKIDFIFVAI